MPYTTLTGLSIKVPTRSTKNWDAVLLVDTFQKIAAHQHTGSGDGNQMVTGSIADNAITGAKIRLANNEWLRGRNSTNTADINVLRVKSDNSIEFTGAVGSTGSVTVDEPGAVIAVDTGETLLYPNLIINALLTFTIPAGGSFCGLHKVTVLGTLEIEGEAGIL